MDKFIILYNEGLHGAIAGTESGTIITLSKDKLLNSEWLNKYHSQNLNVFKIPNEDLISTPTIDLQFFPSKVLEGLEPNPEYSLKVINTDHFQVSFHAFFSANKKLWLIEEKPLILPL